jgi:hypothetical protein
MAPTQYQIEPGLDVDTKARRRRPIDADDLRAHIRKHHRAVRACPYAGKFDDLHSGEWSHRNLTI